MEMRRSGDVAMKKQLKRWLHRWSKEPTTYEYAKCDKCDALFRKAKAHDGWKLRRANHNVAMHGADISSELEAMENE
jgi:hypothetical protein